MKRAFTLLETLIALFLFGVVSALMLALFFPSMWMFQAASARNDAQQTVLLLVTRVRDGLLNTSLDTVTLSSDPPAVSFRAPREESPFDPVSGTPQFASHYSVARYDPNVDKVYWRSWPPEPPAATALSRSYDFSQALVPALERADLALICAHPNSEERVLGDHVDVFSVSDSDADPAVLTPPLQIVVGCSLTNPGPGTRKEERYDMTVQVTPRCQRW